jgi:hypothetical protein
MPLDTDLMTVSGAQELYDWFDCWPTFHDGEIVSLHLNRSGSSSMLIHTWEMTSEIDDKGFFVMQKHVVVEFIFENVSGLNLTGFSVQNVIFGLDLEKTNEGFSLHLDPCYGLAGTIEAKRISIRLNPGKAADRGAAD